MYEAREQEDILSELQEYSTSDASKFEGTFDYDVLSSNSIEFAKIEAEMEQAYKIAFADTSFGEYLTMRCAESGIIRKNAVTAVGTVTVKGNGTLPAGSQFSTTAGISFSTSTMAETVVRSSTDVTVQATVSGSVGNVQAGTITVIPMSIPGITSVTNAEAMHDGYDEETDENLLARYLIHVRTPGTSGNVYHYLEWATGVAGVGGAKVLPTWNGPGTVKVIIVDSDYKAASSTLVEKVKSYIESVRPVGAIVTVVSAETKVINIAANASGSYDIDAFKTSVQDYFISLEKRIIVSATADGTTVSLAKIGSLLLDAGADDYTDLQLNSGTSNISIANSEIATLGTVTLT
jgi:uncharacterized phage protein gp47/JayE